MYQAYDKRTIIVARYSSPPDKRPEAGPGMAGLLEAYGNIVDAICLIARNIKKAKSEAGDYAMLDDAVSEFDWLLLQLRELEKGISSAWNLIDDFVSNQES